MGLLWGNEKKECPDCGMEIPLSARVCPYCHSTQNSTIDDIHQYGSADISGDNIWNNYAVSIPV